MRLSTKGRFAVTAMLDVALRQKNGPVALSDIAVRHQISLSYLEQMFSKLRQHNLVKSTRGPGGGYALAAGTDEITVADIIGAVEGHHSSRHGAAIRGTNQLSAQDGVSDLTMDLWDSFNARMEDYMQSITLKSLVLDQLAKGFRADAPQAAQRGVFKKAKASPAHVRPQVPNSVFALGSALLAKG